MSEKKRLFKVLLDIGNESIAIVALKNFFTPVELSSQLASLVELGIVSVDWKKKKIILENLNYKNLVSKKNKIGEFERNVPEYMKSEKIDINKPFI